MHCTIVTPTSTPHPTPTSTPHPTPTSTPHPTPTSTPHPTPIVTSTPNPNPTMIQFSLEAENGKFTGTHRFRSAASNYSTVWLHNGETVKLSLALMGKSCLLHIKNVVYSNDGNSDRVSVLVDGAFQIKLGLEMLEKNCKNIVQTTEFNSRSPPTFNPTSGSTPDVNSRSPPTSNSSKELLSTCLMLFLTVLYCSCILFKSSYSMHVLC